MLLKKDWRFKKVKYGDKGIFLELISNIKYVIIVFDYNIFLCVDKNYTMTKNLDSNGLKEILDEIKK